MVENARRLRHFRRMKFAKMIAMSLALALAAGCGKPAATAAPPVAQENPLPTHAQPKLQTMKIYLGAETLDAELALTGLQQQTGMMFRTNIQDSDAMLFPLPYTTQASFWMKNCPESISAAYITPDGVIAEIHHLEKNDTNAVLAATDNIRFVLETSDGWFERHHVSTGAVVRTERGSLMETFFQNRQ